MMWKGTSTARAMYAIGIAHIVSMVLADTMPINVLNDTLVTTRHANASLLKGGVGDGNLFVLDGQSNESEMQLRQKMIRQRKMQRYTKSKSKKSKKSKKSSKSRKGNRNKKPNQPQRPVQQPAKTPAQTRPAGSSSCFSVSTYESIDNDIERIKNDIRDDKSRSHFLGGIVRLAAHDFMDYDRRDGRNSMGPDGCFDETHPSNDGLETIWCRKCDLRLLYEEKYSFISRADFWIASANAVVRQTSIDNALDLKETFFWGRKDRDLCQGSGERLPQAKSCNEIEDVFLRNMGLEWKDAVALMGGHTLGRGDRDVSLFHVYCNIHNA